jgi:hypothetical protein
MLVVTGYLMTHEWSIYVFDALLMASVMALTLMWYVGRTIAPGSRPQALEMTS